MTIEIACLTRKHIPKPVGVTKNGKIMLEMDGELVSLDLETQEFKDLRLFGYEYNFVDSYVESLLMLDKATIGAITYRGKNGKMHLVFYVYNWHRSMIIAHI